MRNVLKELEIYDDITIQCHDNPDADTLGAGYGVYCYYKALGKNVRMMYSGRNKIRKSNLMLMIEKLKIPVEYVDLTIERPEIKGLLITVDCQWGAGNITAFKADHTAVIDHHQIEVDTAELSLIDSSLGSCSTIVWKLLVQNDFPISDYDGLGTALYYGLYTDTNQMSEIKSPVDRDAADQIPHENSSITEFRNSNITLEELQIAGVALIRYIFNEEHGFAVLRSEPCDPNILGLIADLVLQVDKVRCCVVYNEGTDGYKISVRSCVREVNASELAVFLTNGVGSGGGHYEKAGGFISKSLFNEKHPGLHCEGYLNNQLMAYFERYEIIYAAEYEVDLEGMELYRKKKLPIGFVPLRDVLPLGTPILIRTLEGDMNLVVEEDLYVIIGVKGEVYPNREAKFLKSNEILDEKYDYNALVLEPSYIPTIKNQLTGENLILTDYARVCRPSGNVRIYSKQLERGVKVFAQWDKERYMLGEPGDYLAVREDDLHDVYVIEQKICKQTYDKVTE